MATKNSFKLAFADLFLLLWKNFTIQFRRPIGALVEILLPCLLMAILAAFRTTVDVETFANYTIYKEFNFLNARAMNGTFVRSIAYVPDNLEANRTMSILIERLNKIDANYQYIALPFQNTFELENTYKGSTTNLAKTFLCAIEFASLSLTSIDFTLRFPSIPRHNAKQNTREDWKTIMIMPEIEIPGPRNENSNDGGSPGYAREGFLFIQHEVSMAAGQALSNKKDNLNNNSTLFEINAERFPFPPHSKDFFLMALSFLFPSIIMFSFIYPSVNLSKSLVVEKEKRLKESMKMMGLKEKFHWIAYFIKSFILTLPSIIIVVVLLFIKLKNNLAIINSSDYFIVFIFFSLYEISNICLCFLISTFFSKANLAGIATGVISFLTFIPSVSAIMQYNDLGNVIKIVYCFLPNTNMAFGIYILLMKESKGIGVTWDNINKPTTAGDNLTFLISLIMMMVNSTIYLLATWYATLAFPGEFGVPLPWYFPFTKRYWFGDDDDDAAILDNNDMASIEYGSDKYQPDPANIEADSTNLKAGIRIKNLTKSYDNGKTYSVRDLCVNMYNGQITALLGHNGAGKTTTISILIGLYRPTRGTAILNGHDIRHNIISVRSDLGICPQFNVLFDELTVAEHLEFYCKLKHTGQSSKEIKQEVKHMIKKLDLVDKTNVRAKNLSGGMQRKLSVGIALVGGSKIVILDEPTSGMDVSARRFIWDLLLQEKTNRTILITTHFMEEADILGDRIAIMANGQLQCCGSSMFLKKRFGAGYHLTLAKKSGADDTDRITTVVNEYVPTAKLESSVGVEVTYSLSNEETEHFEPLLTRIENDKSLNITNYGISMTTMEEVFLKVGDYAKQKIDSITNNNLQKDYADMNRKETVQTKQQNRKAILKNHGFTLLWQQFFGLIIKKLLYCYRSPILVGVQLLLPMILINLVLIMLHSIPRPKESPALHMSISQFNNPMVIYFNRSSTPLANIYEQVLQQSIPKNRIQICPEFDCFKTVSLEEYNYEFMISAKFEETANGIKVTSLFNNQAFHTPAISLRYIDQALIQYIYNLNNFTMQVTNHPMPMIVEDKTKTDVTRVQGQTQIVQGMIFAMAFLVGSFTVLVVKERITKGKHLQTLCGGRLSIYWMAYFLIDFIIYFTSCCLIVVTCVIWREDGLYQNNIPWYLVLVFFMQGLAIIPVVYCLSFLFNLPATAYARLCLIVIIVGISTFIVDQITGIKELNLQKANDIIYPIFAILIPVFSMGKSVTNLIINHGNTALCTETFIIEGKQINIQDVCKLGDHPALDTIKPCCKDFCDDNCLPFEENMLAITLPGIGLLIIYMVISTIFYWFLLFLIEINAFRTMTNFFHDILFSMKTKFIPIEKRDPLLQIDEDVLTEKKNINLIDPKQDNENSMIVKNLSKHYDNFVAVSDISYCVKRGECFGLLGINGAGKTTTFKMITGDESITSGDIFVNGISIRKDIKRIQQEIGYCPQFDALLDDLTGNETLRFYSRLRGIKEDEIDLQIKELSQLLYFDIHINKLVGKYSGGNKRKLSAAISLLGNPSISFLDEPTTGVDPVARRCLWEAINTKLKQGCSVVLTSHSMEECEALCNRLIIMVNGQICCIGSPLHLKSKFGKGFTVLIKVSPGTLTLRSSSISEAKHRRTSSIQLSRLNSNSSHISNSETFGTKETLQQNLNAVKQFMSETFPTSSLKAVHNNLLHFTIDNTDNSTIRCSQLFGSLEKNKKHLRIEDYSVCQTNLEQIFLTFARNQRLTKENVK